MDICPGLKLTASSVWCQLREAMLLGFSSERGNEHCHLLIVQQTLAVRTVED